MKVLLLSSFGDPKDSKLWSGTPENIYRRLITLSNVEVETDNILQFNWINKFIIGLEIVFGLDLRRSKLRNFVTNLFLLIKYKSKLNLYEQVLFFDTVANPGVLQNTNSPTKLSLILDSTVAQWRSETEWGVKANSRIIRRRMKYEQKVLQAFTNFYSLSIQASNSLVDDFDIAESKITRVRTGAGQPLTQIQPPKVMTEKKQISLLTIAKGEHWRKGVDLLFQSLSFDTVEDIKELNALLGSNYKQSVPNKVNSIGLVSLKELIQFYNSADIFVLPCRFEPYGLVFVEAVQMGLPIVTTANSGLGREFVEAGWPGAIVDLDPRSIFQGILNAKDQIYSAGEAIENLQTEILSLFDWNQLTLDIISA